MPNIPLTLLVHFAILLAGVAALRVAGRPTAIRPLACGLAIVVLYWIISPLGLWLQGRTPGLASAHWNWLGKALMLAAGLLWWRLSGLSRTEIGLTWRQRAASLLPAAMVIAAVCAFAWIDEALLADGRDLSAERLAFQAIMPGLDEELIFRGLIFAYFARAFGAGRAVAQGAFGWAGVAVTFLFAAGHGLFVANGALVVQWHALFTTGMIGAALLWLRTHTGSLIAPVVAHNVSNFGNSFF